MGSNSKTCMNSACGVSTSFEWKTGWPLRSRGFADLCYRCGIAYESSYYCETFHLEQPGWRECYICRKRLHCGCIASKFLYEFLDLGGVGCTICANGFQPKLVNRNKTTDELNPFTEKTPVDKQATNGQSRTFGNNISGGRPTRLFSVMDDNKPELFSQPERSGTKASPGEEKPKEVRTIGELANLLKPESERRMLDVLNTQEAVSQPYLSTNLGSSPSVPPFSSSCIERKEQGTASPAQKTERSFPILPKPFGSSVIDNSLAPQMRLGRPPVEGRGKNHLLPRYRPRITDQELQQISGNLNSTVVPLFEKVLSASDAGRIGRLVLPKACAEAYFPITGSSERTPLRVQDVNGKEWTFQFRFWPNNNSRMYVLEGVTPCIQSMQLQAGDIVTFSRIDPGGKLIMGFRKGTKLEEQQGSQKTALSNGVSAEKASSLGLIKNHPTVNGSLGIFQITTEGKDSQVSDPSGKLESADGDVGLLRNGAAGGRMSEDLPRTKEKKRTRKVGYKSKRMLIKNEATELRFPWEEAQDLLRPAPGAKPTTVTIDSHNFEEYDEPPVFGKRTIFTSGLSVKEAQWAQCDDCCKWRRIPVDVLLTSKWTCSGNAWDSSRCSCSAAEEPNAFGIEDLLRIGTGSESKKRSKKDTQKPVCDDEPCGLKALSCAAVLGESTIEPPSTEARATTRHPRHPPGCTCIVCIQPPSGKGKHNPSCTCNVCTMVKRRFTTQMMRRKKRQLEREAEANQKDQNALTTINPVETEEKGTVTHRKTQTSNEGSQEGGSRVQGDLAEPRNAGIDLNFDPNGKEFQQLVEDVKEVVSLGVESNGTRQPESHCCVDEEGKASKVNEGCRDSSSGIRPVE